MKALLLLGNAKIRGTPYPNIFWHFFYNFPPKIEGFAQFPTVKEKMHFSAEKIGDSPKSETNWALICSTIKSSINWIYTIYGIIHHNNIKFRVFASANTLSFFQILIHTLVCLFVKCRWDYVVLVVEGSKIILLLELTGQGHRIYF